MGLNDSELDDDDDFTKKMDALNASFAAGLTARMEEIEHSLASLRSEQTPENIESRLTQMLNLSHKLAGSGGTFGFVDVSKKSATIAKICETRLHEGGVLGASHMDQLGGLIKALEKSIRYSLIQNQA